MRARALAVAIALVSIVIGGCGGGDDNSKPPISSRSKPPTSAGVSTVVRDYMEALSRGDGKRACSLLDERGQAGLIAFLPSNKAKLKCEKAVLKVSKQAVPLHNLRIVDVKVLGKAATANVKVTNPPYSSGVLLSRVDDRWKISYPPGLLEKSSPPPGVPLEQD
jgi:hypothetical protein